MGCSVEVKNLFWSDGTIAKSHHLCPLSSAVLPAWLLCASLKTSFVCLRLDGLRLEPSLRLRRAFVSSFCVSVPSSRCDWRDSLQVVEKVEFLKAQMLSSKSSAKIAF